jgi:hypothetical protein
MRLWFRSLVGNDRKCRQPENELLLIEPSKDHMRHELVSGYIAAISQ